MEIFLGTVMVPSSALSSPLIIRKRVVFPAPFGPTSPAFSPGLSWKEASTKMTWRPYCLLTEAKEIMDAGQQGGRRRCSVRTAVLSCTDHDQEAHPHRQQRGHRARQAAPRGARPRRELGSGGLHQRAD